MEALSPGREEIEHGMFIKRNERVESIWYNAQYYNNSKQCYKYNMDYMSFMDGIIRELYVNTLYQRLSRGTSQSPEGKGGERGENLEVTMYRDSFKGIQKRREGTQVYVRKNLCTLNPVWREAYSLDFFFGYREMAQGKIWWALQDLNL